MLFQVEAPGLGGAVVGAGEEGREGHDIELLRLPGKGRQIVRRRRAGRTGGGRALLHPPEQVGLVKGGVVHHRVLPHPDGEGDGDHLRVAAQSGGQIAAAVYNNLKSHIYHSLI